MSEIIKTEAIVLSKLKYGDTSSIVSLFTKKYGRLSAIIKGGRSGKLKMGLVVDPLNHLEIIIYIKDTRDIQILSGADMFSYYPRIKEDLERMKCSYAILELVKKLTPEHEANEKLFKGLIKIFSLFETSDEKPKILFGRFFMFFLTELGYELPIEKCVSCGRSNLNGMDLGYNFELGIFCSSCRKDYIESFLIVSELFSYLTCLKHNLKVMNAKEYIPDKAIEFLELYLKHHVADFNGIKSFKLFNEVE